MRRLRLAGMVLLAALAVILGVGESPAQKTAVESSGTATIKGRVVYDGTPPDRAAADAAVLNQVIGNGGGGGHCLKDPTKESTRDQTWRFGKDGGVANVAVWIRPPAGKFFKKPDDDKKTWKEEVMVDQPYCAFVPHVVVLYAETWDEKAKKLVPTGQKFKFMNSAPMNHNTAWRGSEVKGIGGNIIIPPKGEQEKHLASNYGTVITVNCDFHKWMRGYIWSLETPYAAVTDKDGHFEIKNVPAGIELQIVAWHEQPGFFAAGGSQGEKLTLKAGETVTKEFKVKAK